MDKEKIRLLIEEEIKKTKKSIETYSDSSKPISPENAIGRISRMDAINNKSISEAALRTARQKLKGLENALDKIDSESFGKCARCKKTIPIQRLLLVPQNPFCVNCAT